MIVDGVGILILANDEMPVGGDAEIVAEIEQRAIARFDEEIEQPRLIALARPALETRGAVAHDLAELGDAAGGAAEEEFTAPEINAFAAREERCAGRMPALA